MELTGVVKIRPSDRHLVVLSKKARRPDVVMAVAKFYCRASRNYEVVFQIDHGARHLTLTIDFLLFDSDPIYQLAKLGYEHNITGVVTNSLEEAEQVATVIEKAYAWALLKE